jgi:S-DNA-T family DNA segregation ATPase FtsK/SpoIIIE
MAYPTRGRDPLLDATTQAFLEKRGVEALGLIFILVGVFLILTLASYSPGDSAWMSSGGREIGNLFGQLGATITAPLMKIMGLGSWSIPFLFVVWGMRLMTHIGAERMVIRLIYAPIFWALCSLYLATATPNTDWVHNFSMGGLFGDTVLYIILQLMPGSAALGANIIAVILGLLVILLAYYVSGLVFSELKLGFRALSLGVSKSLFFIGKLIASGMLRGAITVKNRRKVKDISLNLEPSSISNSDIGPISSGLKVHGNFDPLRSPPLKPAPISKSFFSRVPEILKLSTGQAEKSILSSNASNQSEDLQKDRIRDKIADVIRLRTPQVDSESAPKSVLVTSKVGRPTGPVPMVLQSDLDVQREDNPTDSFGDELLNAELMPLDHSTEQLDSNIMRPVVQHSIKKPIQPSSQAIDEANPKLQFEAQSSVQNYEKPPLGLLMNPTSIQRHILSDDALESNARMLESVLDDYGVKGDIVSVRPGPVVTMYELEPAPGLKASRVIGLSDDIARSMSALSARVSTVPGRTVIGIELPNDNREMCALREILSARDFGDANMKLPLALGKDIGGEPIVVNLAKMPHLLIAGTTGSGKSVAINTMILSLLYRLTPEECRMIMIDPKMLELSVYDGIPHLLSPVVTDPKKAVVALKWTVGEMEDRYRKMSKMGVRNIDGYNSRVRDAQLKGEMFSRTVQTGFDDGTGEPLFETEEFAPETLPYIVVVVDEMADLMMVAGKEIEACIQRLAQMARASGIHIIMATQRPSVDVITGTIKANFPTRISFQVTSKVDSRTILGEMGAEQLLGMGDMLYMAGGGKITRVHGPFCSDEEVEDVVKHLKTFGPPKYVSGVVEGSPDGKENDIDAVLGLGGNSDVEDALYDTAVQIVIRDRKCSTSYIQRKLAIGYNKAARLVEQMEDSGLVSAANHVGKREILVPEQA